MTIQEITKGYKFGCIIRINLKEKLLNKNICEAINILNNKYDITIENIKIFDVNKGKYLNAEKCLNNKKTNLFVNKAGHKYNELKELQVLLFVK